MKRSSKPFRVYLVQGIVYNIRNLDFLILYYIYIYTWMIFDMYDVYTYLTTPKISR